MKIRTFKNSVSHNIVMAKKSIKKQSKKSGDFKTQAFVATFLSIIGFVIAIVSWRKDNYVMFYAKQSLIVLPG